MLIASIYLEKLNNMNQLNKYSWKLLKHFSGFITGRIGIFKHISWISDSVTNSYRVITLPEYVVLLNKSI